MSNKIIKGLTIQIGADTLGLDKALKDVEAKGKSASSELREINSAIKITGDSTALWEQKQKLLNDALAASREKVKVLEDAQKGFTERFKNGEIDQGTYDKFRDKLTKSRDVLAALKSQQEQVEAKFKSGEIDQGKYDRFRKSVEDAEKQVKNLETAEHSMEENLRLGNISEEQYRAFQRETEYARSAVKKYEDGLNEANPKVIELGNESDNTADDVKELGEKADHTASGGISAMTVALGNLVADGIKKAGSELKDFTKDIIQTGADFEAAMSNVAAISGADKAGLEQLTAKAEEMGATTKFTARESADAFQYMAMAGWKTEDMLGGIEGIMSLAAASGEDLATTSDIVTDALTAFGLTAADSGHFADVLAAASSNANTNVAMMGETFKYVAPIAGALDFSVEDTAEAIGIMANSGIKASQAGTSLRAILTAMTDTSDKAYFAFQELNVETLNAGGSMRSLNEILSDLRTGWQGLTEAEQADYAQRIAGKQAMSGFLSLVNAAPADIDKLSVAIRDCDGAASDMSTTMVDNLQGDMTILGSAVDGMKISLSKKLNPALRDVTQYVTSKMPEIEKVLEKVGSKAIKVLDFSVKNLPKAVDFLKKSMPVIKGVGAAFAAWKLGQAAKSLGDFNGKIKDSGGLMKNLTGLISGNPFAVVATGVGIATTAIDYFKDKVKAGKSEIKKFTEEQEAYQKAARDSIEEIQNLRKEVDENAIKINIEYDDIQKKWDELQTLVDQNGKIKEGYEARVNYITHELTDATGIEIELVDGQIQKYQELKDTIQKTIDKQRAQRLFAAYSEKEAEYIQNRDDAKDEVDTARQAYEDADENYKTVKSRTENAMRQHYYNKMAWDYDNLSFEEARVKYADDFYADSDIQKFIEKINKAEADREAAEEILEVAKEKYFKADTEINRILHAESLIAEGRYNEATHYMTALNDQYKKTVSDVKAGEDEKVEAYNDSLRKFQSDLSLAKESNSKANKESSKESVETVAKTLAEMTGLMLQHSSDHGKVYSQNWRNVVEELINSGIDLTTLKGYFEAEGIDLGEILGSSIIDGLSGISAPITNALGDFAGAILSRYNDPQPLPMFANGGFLPSGQGIVAEAGPELIEIMNGGAKITPLTGNARNTAVSGADGNRSRVVYINNTINANISGKYDIRRMTEDMADEQRRVERNMGL